MADLALVGRIAAGVEKHVVRRRRGRGLAIVERGDLATSCAMHDKPAAPDIAGIGQHHLEREAHGDGGVDGVAALLEDFDAGLRGERVRGDHHRVAPGDRA